MRFVKWFLNLLVLCITFVLSSVVTVGVYDGIAAPAGDAGIIKISETVKEGEEYTTDVTYFDTFKFWGEDLSQSVTREPRYMIRSWFAADWWQNGMKWADVAVEAVVGAVVPVFAPMYEVQQIGEYYMDKKVDSVEVGYYTVDGLVIPDKDDFSSVDSLNDPIVLEKYKDCNLYIEDYYLGVDGFKNGDECSGILGKVVFANGEYSFHTFSCWNTDAKIGSAEWNKKSSGFINELCKINKYNSVDENGNKIYKKWVSKFFYGADSSTGEASAKTVVCALYYQFIIAVVFSIWFVVQNPIVLERTDDGNMVKGGLRNPFKFKKHKRKDKKEK